MAQGVTPTHAGEEIPLWAPHFLQFLTERASVYCAARGAGVSRTEAYRCRDKFPAFAAAWDEIAEGWTDKIEATCVELAVEGQREPIVNREGQVVGERVTRYPRLNEFLLSTRRREVYGRETAADDAAAFVERVRAYVAASQQHDGLEPPATEAQE